MGAVRIEEVGSGGGIQWEWGRLFGIRANVATSDFVTLKRSFFTGDFNGGVYRQESGVSFNGQDIISVYAPPFLDQGDTEVSKTYRAVNLFLRPEGVF